MIAVTRIYKSSTLPLILQRIRMSSTIGVCVPCSGLNRDDLIPVEQLQQRLTELIPLWTLYETGNRNTGTMNNNGDTGLTKNYYSINRKFTAKNFQSAMNCLNEIGRLAEEQNHHPDLHLVNYRDIHIELCTHKLNGVTENDVILAHAIDTKVSIEYSPKWLKNHPELSGTS